jgi:Pyridoxamine 5'-phosphate oxidase
VFRWADFEAAAPDMAALGRDLLERFGIAFVGTVRKDGGPRVNPVEFYVVDGQLTCNMMWRSLKALDLLRDPRVFIHTVVSGRDGSEGEFKLSGVAVSVEDADLRHAVADAIETAIRWRPPERSHFFAIDVESAAYVDYEGGDQHVRRWSRQRGEF